MFGDKSPGAFLALLIFVTIIVILIIAASICHHDGHNAPASCQNITSLPATVGSGTHYVQKELTWSGSSPAITITDNSNVTIIFTNSGKITLNGVGATYNLDDPNQSYTGLQIGILATGSSHLEVLDAQITSNQAAVNNALGIVAQNGSNVVVRNGTFSNLSQGVVYVGINGGSISSNDFIDIYGLIPIAESPEVATGAGVTLESSKSISVDFNNYYTTGTYSDPTFSSTAVYAGLQANYNISASANSSHDIQRGYKLRAGSGYKISGDKISTVCADNQNVVDSGCIHAGGVANHADDVSVLGCKLSTTGLNGVPFTTASSASSSIAGNTVHTSGAFYNCGQVGSGAVVRDNNFTSDNYVGGMDGLIVGNSNIEDFVINGVQVSNNNFNLQMVIGIEDGYRPAVIRLEDVIGGQVIHNSLIGGSEFDDNYGILLEVGSSRCTIKDNTISAFGAGIEDDGGKSNIIVDNNISGGGIFLYGTSCDQVINNTISDGCTSVFLDCETQGNVVTGNTLSCTRSVVDEGWNNIVEGNIGGDPCGVCDTKLPQLSALKNKKDARAKASNFGNNNRVGKIAVKMINA